MTRAPRRRRDAVIAALLLALLAWGIRHTKPNDPAETGVTRYERP